MAIQLKLRDLSGLIVIDFIDMLIPKNNRLIENILKQRLHTDRAKIQVGNISSFGLLEMSRQRLRPSIYEADFTKCNICDGIGRVRSIESLTLKALHEIEEVASNSKENNITIDLPKETAVHILNNKRKEINAIEEKRKINVTIIPNNSLDKIKNIDLKNEINHSSQEKKSKTPNKIKRNINKNQKTKNPIKKVNKNLKLDDNTNNKKTSNSKQKTNKEVSLKKPKNIKVKKTTEIKENSEIEKTTINKNEKIEKKQIKRKKGPIKTGWWNKETA